MTGSFDSSEDLLLDIHSRTRYTGDQCMVFSFIIVGPIGREH